MSLCLAKPDTQGLIPARRKGTGTVGTFRKIYRLDRSCRAVRLMLPDKRLVGYGFDFREMALEELQDFISLPGSAVFLQFLLLKLLPDILI